MDWNVIRVEFAKHADEILDAIAECGPTAHETATQEHCRMLADAEEALRAMSHSPLACLTVQSIIAKYTGSRT